MKDTFGICRRRPRPTRRAGRWIRTPLLCVVITTTMLGTSSVRCLIMPHARRTARSFLTADAFQSWALSSSTTDEANHYSKLMVNGDAGMSSSSSSSSSPLIKPWQSLFDLELPEGRCVGIRLHDQDSSHPEASLSPESIAADESHWIHALLHPEEIRYAMAQPSETAQHSFFLGRLAMREAMLIPPDASILRDEFGRPSVPEGYLGSISHKRTTGVALVALDHTTKKKSGNGPTKGIGVDIEQTFSTRRSIAKRVLTERELNELGGLEGITKEEEVLLRFSLKESLYKAVHPLICQYVGFQEAEVTPHQNGTATVTWNLKTKAHERIGKVTAHWRKLEAFDYFLTSGSVILKDE